jgi:hypothetical protein
MKAANPDISNPLSRSKKSTTTKSSSFLILLMIVTLGITALTLFYVTVSTATNTHDIQLPHFGEGSKQHNINNYVNNDNHDNNDPPQHNHEKAARLHLTTWLGKIIITLTPEFSAESISYIRNVVDVTNGCEQCAFYRAEKPGILQGIMKKKKKKKKEKSTNS